MRSALQPSPAIGPQRWSFVVPTALGRTRSTYTFTGAELRFESDDLFGGNQTLRWDRIDRAATASMPGMGGPGAPDMPDWIPARIEWLLISQSGGAEPFMRILPQGADRDALVAALEARLGPRWVGHGLALADAQSRTGVTTPAGSTLKTIGIVVAVIALLLLLLIAIGFLLHPLIVVPALTAAGLWLIGKGRRGLRAADAAATMAVVKVADAADGPVTLQGRAFGHTTTPSAVTGRPCLWWDVTVEAESTDGDGDTRRYQLASRHGGSIDRVQLDDASGRITVWLHGAELLMDKQAFDSQEDDLPARGRAFLDTLGFPWGRDRRLRVTESGLGVGASLFVIGTVDERQHVALPVAPDSIAGRVTEAVRSGSWRRSLVAAAPPPARVVVAVLIGYLDLLLNLGQGQDRSRSAPAPVPPDLPPTERLVWRGSSGAPFIVSDHAPDEALERWRQRSKWHIGIGAVLLVLALLELKDWLVG